MELNELDTKGLAGNGCSAYDKIIYFLQSDGC